MAAYPALRGPSGPRLCWANLIASAEADAVFRRPSGGHGFSHAASVSFFNCHPERRATKRTCGSASRGIWSHSRRVFHADRQNRQARRGPWDRKKVAPGNRRPPRRRRVASCYGVNFSVDNRSNVRYCIVQYISFLQYPCLLSRTTTRARSESPEDAPGTAPNSFAGRFLRVSPLDR